MSLAHTSPVRAVLPSLAQAPDAGLAPLALRVAFFVRADHHQQAVDQIHGVFFEPCTAVGLSVARRDHGDARIYNLGQLRLSLDGLCAREAVQPLHDQHRSMRYTSVLHGPQEHPERTTFNVLLVVSAQALVAEGQAAVELQAVLRGPFFPRMPAACPCCSPLTAWGPRTAGSYRQDL